MRNIDLIPPDLTARRETTSRLKMWLKRLGIAGAAGAAIYGGLYGLAEGHHSELRGLKREYSSLQDRLQRAGSLLQERERLSRNREAIVLIRNGRTAVQILSVVEEALTPESRLTYLDLARCPFRDPAAPPSQDGDNLPTKLVLRGLAPNHQQVGRIIRNLIVSEEFSDVALVSTSDPDRAGDGEVEFEILCRLAGEGAAPGPERYGNIEAERADE